MKYSELLELGKSKRFLSPQDFAKYYFFPAMNDTRINKNSCSILHKFLNTNPSTNHLQLIARTIKSLSKHILNHVYTTGRIDLPTNCGSISVCVKDKFHMPYGYYTYCNWATPGEPFIYWDYAEPYLSSSCKLPPEAKFYLADNIHNYCKTHRPQLLQVAQPFWQPDEYTANKTPRKYLKQYYILHPELKPQKP